MPSSRGRISSSPPRPARSCSTTRSGFWKTATAGRPRSPAIWKWTHPTDERQFEPLCPDDGAGAGEEIIIAKAGKPLVKLIPYQEKLEPRTPGGWEGKVIMSDDFDDELPPDLLAGFMGEEE